mgnify:CR=1 FL=1
MEVPTIISAIGSLFSEAISWVGDVAEAITSNPILLVFAVLPLVGLGVGLFKRLISVR